MNNSHVSIPIPTESFLDLAEFLREQGSNRDPVQAVDEAIQYWIENASWKKEDLMPEIFAKEHGYRWKKVFLPHGTRIRMRYKGKYYYAQVVHDEILYEDQSLSPGEFANLIANSSRNAWRALEIRRPNDGEWYLADELRSPSAELPELDLDI